MIDLMRAALMMNFYEYNTKISFIDLITEPNRVRLEQTERHSIRNTKLELNSKWDIC